jgi:hypothetical protein
VAKLLAASPPSAIIPHGLRAAKSWYSRARPPRRQR